MGHFYNGTLLGYKKEENFTLCDSVDGPGEHYAKGTKPVRERQIPYDFTPMWDLMNWTTKQNRDRLIDGEQMTAIGAGEWLSKKEKEFMDMDNSVVIAGGRGYKGTKW